MIDPTEHLDVAWRAARQHWRRGGFGAATPGVDFDDVEAEAHVVLVTACRRYKPENSGGNVDAYLMQRIKWGLVDWYRATFGRFGERGAEVWSLDATIPGADDLRIADTLVERDDDIAASDIVALLDRLPAREAAIVNARIDGRTLASIAAEYGFTESRACQILGAARTHLLSELEAA